MAPSAHEEMCAAESEPFDGNAPSHVVVDDHVNESEHVISIVNTKQTDSVQEESFVCVTSDSPFPSSPAHSSDQRDVFSHHNDSLDVLDTSDDEIVIEASSTNLIPFLLNALLITALQINLVVRLIVL